MTFPTRPVFPEIYNSELYYFELKGAYLLLENELVRANDKLGGNSRSSKATWPLPHREGIAVRVSNSVGSYSPRTYRDP